MGTRGAIMRSSLFTLALGILAVAPFPADALCIPKPASPDRSSPYVYLEHVIDSLTWVKQGRLRLKDQEGEDLGELLYRTKAAQADYKCAAQIIAPFSDSSDEMVRSSAPLLVAAYEGLVVISQQTIDEIVRFLNELSKGDVPPMGAAMDRLTTLGVRSDDVWKLLPLAIVSSTYSLPKFDGQNPTGRFRITSSQRRELMQSLEKQFGASVRQGMRAGQHALDGAAGVLYQFLADRKWRSADEP